MVLDLAVKCCLLSPLDLPAFASDCKSLSGQESSIGLLPLDSVGLAGYAGPGPRSLAIMQHCTIAIPPNISPLALHNGPIGPEASGDAYKSVVAELGNDAQVSVPACIRARAVWCFGPAKSDISPSRSATQRNSDPRPMQLAPTSGVDLTTLNPYPHGFHRACNSSLLDFRGVHLAQATYTQRACG
jgi:hypothetical protein